MKYKMLMIGPGHGNNIEPWLEQLNKQEVFSIDFVCNSYKFEKKRFDKINIIEIESSRKAHFSHFKIAIQKKYDIIYIQGNCGYDELIYLLFTRAKIKIFNIWSENVINITKKGPLKYKMIGNGIFILSNYIFSNWFGTKEQFDNYFPKYKSKSKLTFFGFQNDLLVDNKKPHSEYIENFINSIPADKVVCFWPKSFHQANRQDLVVKALNQIKLNDSKLLDNFVLYLWVGNVEDKSCRQIVEQLINKFRLNDIIKIIDHPFVPYSDILLIQKRSDFAIHFGDTDQLSSTIIEPIMMKKDIILSNIRPYQFLNEIYGMDIQLIDNDIAKIAKAIHLKLKNFENVNQDLLDKRAKIVFSEEFNFSSNFQKILNLLINSLENIKLK